MVHSWTNLIRTWVENRKLSGQDEIKTGIWHDIELVLHEFVEFIQRHEHEHAWTIACDASPDGEAQEVSLDSTEKGMCRLMLLALYFKNGWEDGTGHTERAWAADNEFKKFIRCVIVNIYMYMLLEATCQNRKGVKYALYVMGQMEESMKDSGVEMNICKWQDHKGTGIGGVKVHDAIMHWFEENEQMMEKIREIEDSAQCRAGSKDHKQINKEEDVQKLKEGIKEKLGALEKEVTQQRLEEEKKIAGRSAAKPSDAQSTTDQKPAKDPEAPATPSTDTSDHSVL
ncbi:hypothetical protein AK88_00826 [Plasmodium fragile]|uniref:Schizont-infected cell agglutination extracellular alpha domain-containing protein n=1 Tax=Plasmodium fragile TaxID=5857 RepID=A0A0D9QRA5_PLAFR|nr:uncharacterized protein AK88_00826 [Plasmodium fragile]KJP89615.1 hypothetical protein AK88_00826 [Plasmodium fragile]